MAIPTGATPQILLQAYRSGIFPMAESAKAPELHWYDPPQRTIFPLDTFHVGRRLRRTIRQRPYRITCDQDFSAVISGCAQAQSPTRQETWINAEIIALYTALHRQGNAHSLEAWQNDKLVGGLYGVHIGGAFFGESMFSTATDASKICLVTLVALLRQQGFALLDCQFKNPHLVQFGAQTISRAAYQRRLQSACALQCGFFSELSGGSFTTPAGAGSESVGNALDGLTFAFLQETTQTS